MLLSRLFQRGTPEAKKPVNGVEHLIPDAYFTTERCADLAETLGRIGSVGVKKITILNK